MSLAELQPMVHRMAARLLCRVPSNVERDDLEQVGMIAAWRCLSTYRADGGASLATHAQHRVAGAMLDALRAEDPLSRRHRKAIKSGEASGVSTVGLDDAASVPDPAPSPEAAVARAQVLAALRVAVDQLSPLQREVVGMHVRDDRDFAFIGRSLAMPRHQVVVAYRHAIAALQRAMVPPPAPTAAPAPASIHPPALRVQPDDWFHPDLVRGCAPTLLR